MRKITDKIRNIYDKLKRNKKARVYSMAGVMVATILMLSIGYSAFGIKVNISDIIADIIIKKDVRISGVSVATEEEVAANVSLEVGGGSSDNDSSSGDYVCTPVTSSEYGNVPTGNYAYGDEYLCDPGDGTTRTFYVLEVGTNTVSLIMDSNLSRESTWSDDYIDSEPTTALNSLTTQTSGWTSVSVNLPTYNQIYAVNDSTNLSNSPWLGIGIEQYSWYWLKDINMDELGAAYAVKNTGMIAIGNADMGMTGGIRPVITLSTELIQPISSGSNTESITLVNDGISKYEEYNVNNISVGIDLPNETSSITYKVSLINLGNAEVGILSIDGLPSNITYKLSGLDLKEKICDSSNKCSLGIEKEFYITFYYVDGSYDSSDIEHDIVANFNFSQFYTVTYTDITNNGYPTSILDGETLTVDFGSNAPKGLIVKVNNAEISNYTYVAGVLTIPSINGNVEIIKEEVQLTLVQHITDLYNSSTKTNSLAVDGITYQVDTTNGLMDDRLGGTVASGGNIRYYGATPNNYIDIGDRDSSGNVILWRIIGVFKNMSVVDDNGNVTGTEDLVKIIRNDSIGKYSWDNKPSGTGSSSSSFGSNVWHDSRLMMLLNPPEDTASIVSSNSSIYAYTRGLYWNSGSGDCYSGSNGATTSCNFTSSGLSPSAQSKVQSVVWNLGGWTTYSSLYSNDWYGYERGEERKNENYPATWSGKIGLMYPSDYGYAADLTQCNQDLDSSFNTSTCTGTDWLFNSSISQWTLTPSSSGSYSVFRVNSSGYVSYNDARNRNGGVRPVLYLKSNVNIMGEERTSGGISYYVAG